MLTVTVEAAVAPDDTAKVIALFENHAPAVRDMPGCTRYDLYREAGGGETILILQHWISDEAFGAYRRSEAFLALAAGLKPIMTDVPVTTISEVAR